MKLTLSAPQQLVLKFADLDSSLEFAVWDEEPWALGAESGETAEKPEVTLKLWNIPSVSLGWKTLSY